MPLRVSIVEANEYQTQANRTSRINWSNINGPDVALLGIIGELGSLASVIKKYQRDSDAYSDFESHFIEELGDVLWYVTIVSTRLGVRFSKWPDARNFNSLFEGVYSLHEHVYEVSKERASLSQASERPIKSVEVLVNELLRDLQGLAVLMGADLFNLSRYSCDKILSYWCSFDSVPARKFDADFPSYERLPREFVVDFIDVDNGDSLIIMMNGIAIGDRLTDNSYLDDGYRFHDVFHLAGAVTLGWSPVFRRMLKRKRKSDSKKDEVEDGARAAIIEEAVINHIYDYARPNFLEGMTRVDLDLIKRIQNLVRGYEVAECEPWEWEDCILKSYEIFRMLRKSGGGRLLMNAETRTITYKKIKQVIE